MNKNKLSRRGFLKGAATTVAGVIAFPYIVASSAMGKAGSVAASNRITLGCIGVGPRGRLNTRGLMHHGAQVVAVCDVDEKARRTYREGS